VIVEDQDLTAEALELAVSSLGVEVLGHARDADEAEEKVLDLKPDMVFMDVQLGRGRDGIDVSLALAPKSDSRIIFVTGSKEPDTMRRIEADHPFRVLFKPFRLDQLREAIDAA
jgi:DNA-binding NarL/FixJ family response regulator